MQKTKTDEEIALRIIGIYFEEIAKRGEKRRIDFDSMINSYFYVLEKLKSKEELLSSMKEKVFAEEKKLLKQSKEELLPSLESLKEKIPEKNY